MNGLDDFKNQVLKKIKKLSYENKKLKQENEELWKKKKQADSDLIVSKSETIKALTENRKLQKIISGNKKKIIVDGLVEIDEEMEMPLFGNIQKINVFGKLKKTKQ